mmetsp:Transcript_14440/g.25864  ORF Transcript_14440/g.25864 Transcript_14440/m.25864 type:complete len:299 (+) Transcript_14440:279-1175(+)
MPSLRSSRRSCSRFLFRSPSLPAGAIAGRSLLNRPCMLSLIDSSDGPTRDRRRSECSGTLRLSRRIRSSVDARSKYQTVPTPTKVAVDTVSSVASPRARAAVEEGDPLVNFLGAASSLGRPLDLMDSLTSFPSCAFCWFTLSRRLAPEDSSAANFLFIRSRKLPGMVRSRSCSTWRWTPSLKPTVIIPNDERANRPSVQGPTAPSPCVPSPFSAWAFSRSSRSDMNFIVLSSHAAMRPLLRPGGSDRSSFGRSSGSLSGWRALSSLPASNAPEPSRRDFNVLGEGVSTCNGEQASRVT